ncbi:MAG: hypothetical protein H6607_06085 [Flavobacteriales bacterium]|nr:hypothetical protein [Flavobacteriales bacterium]
MKQKAETAQYIVDTNPRYNINDSWIMLKKVDPKNTVKWPKTHLDDLSREFKPKAEQPNFCLSTYELPAILFYEFLCKKYSIKVSNAEGVIIGHERSYNSLIADIKGGSLLPLFEIPLYNKNSSYNKMGVDLQFENEIDHRFSELEHTLQKYNLEIEHIPRIVRNYLLNLTHVSVKEKAKTRLKELQNECDALLDRHERLVMKVKQSPKEGKRKFTELKSGNIADFLARDILFLQPAVEINKGKANSTEFQVLQANFAYFNRDKYKLFDFWKSLNLINSKNPHPFLKEMNPANFQNIQSFYKSYLQKRKNYFGKCLTTSGFENLHFLRIRETPTIKEQIANRFDNVPFNIPRKLFTSHILDILKTKGTSALKEALGNARNLNVSFMIKAFFEFELQDNGQPYFQYKRSYDWINKLEDTRTKKQKFIPLKKQYYHLTELEKGVDNWKNKMNQKPEATDNEIAIKGNLLKLYKQFEDNEKQLRLTQLQDRALFLSHTLLSTCTSAHFVPGENDYQLKNIKNLLNKSGKIEVSIPYQVIDYVDKERKLEGSKIIFQNDLRRKNFGDFRRFMKDRRINDLLPYFNDSRIERGRVEAELTRYDELREDFAEILYRFEQNVIHNHKHSFGDYFVNHTKNYIGFLEVLEIYKNQRSVSDEEADMMRWIRNSFVHNQFPSIFLFGSRVDDSQTNLFIDQIYNIVKPLFYANN